MPLYCKFSMRKKSYYTAMQLWQTFGMTDNQPFTSSDACCACGRPVSGSLKALHLAGVIRLRDGKKRAPTRHTGEKPIAIWVFTHSFASHMQTDDGMEELAIALSFIEKEGVQLACA